MATEKRKRSIELSTRPATVTNLNFQPEKAGEELVERVDMSIEFLLEDVDVPELVNTKSNPLKVLWDAKGGPMLRELGKLEISIKGTGTAQFGVDEEHLIEFKNAVLKKVVVEPMLGLKASVKCQIRVDPTGYLEDLGDMRIRQQCVFSFTGSGTEPKSADQTELSV